MIFSFESSLREEKKPQYGHLEWEPDWVVHFSLLAEQIIKRKTATENQAVAAAVFLSVCLSVLLLKPPTLTLCSTNGAFFIQSCFIS